MATPKRRREKPFTLAPDQQERLVDALCGAISAGHYKSALKALARQLYAEFAAQGGRRRRAAEPLGARQCEEYLSRARTQLIQQAELSPGEARGHVLDNVYKILRGRDSTARDKLEALEAMRDMLGLDLPSARDHLRAKTASDAAAGPSVIRFELDAPPAET